MRSLSVHSIAHSERNHRCVLMLMLSKVPFDAFAETFCPFPDMLRYRRLVSVYQATLTCRRKDSGYGGDRLATFPDGIWLSLALLLEQPIADSCSITDCRTWLLGSTGDLLSPTWLESRIDLTFSICCTSSNSATSWALA